MEQSRGEAAMSIEAIVAQARALSEARREIERLRERLAAAESKVDALMLEFCPDEMSDEQRSRWADSQRVSESNL